MIGISLPPAGNTCHLNVIKLLESGFSFVHPTTELPRILLHTTILYFPSLDLTTDLRAVEVQNDHQACEKNSPSNAMAWSDFILVLLVLRRKLFYIFIIQAAPFNLYDISSLQTKIY